jgi:hypothetical protein
MQEIAFQGFKFQTFSVSQRAHGADYAPKHYSDQIPLGIHAWYVGHMAIPHYYIISQKGPFSKNAPPTEKSLKKALIKVIYVYCVSKAVGKTNTVPPPLGPYAHVVPCLQPSVPSNGPRDKLTICD